MCLYCPIFTRSHSWGSVQSCTMIVFRSNTFTHSATSEAKGSIIHYWFPKLLASSNQFSNRDLSQPVFITTCDVWRHGHIVQWRRQYTTPLSYISSRDGLLNFENGFWTSPYYFKARDYEDSKYCLALSRMSRSGSRDLPRPSRTPMASMIDTKELSSLTRCSLNTRNRSDSNLATWIWNKLQL